MTRKPRQKTLQTASTPQAPVLEPSTAATDALDKRDAPLWRNVNVQKALYLVMLAALYSPLSQMILSPVYGSIPSAAYHKYLLMGSSLLAFASRNKIPPFLEKLLPSLAFWIPSIQFVLIGYSEQLGISNGPLVTELLTTFPLVTLSMYMAYKLFDDVDLSFILSGGNYAEAAPPMILHLAFTLVQRVLSKALPQWTSQNFLLTRVGLQLGIAIMYGMILPRSLFWPAIPSIAFTILANPHAQLQRTTAVLNNTLALYDYNLLERYESVTGYLSVLEDNKKEFRVLRCDHSLLGGEWKMPSDANRKVGEPIYAVFTMLEAVRLIESPIANMVVRDSEKSALNIGLGIGTAPSAMIAHGINTTILELDPVVHYFAGKYFNLPKNHSYHIGDAVAVVDHYASKLKEEAGEADPEQKQYDIVLHDTFTGGALPVPLFTYTFLNDLSKLMKPTTGVIAINYAGDLNMPSASIIYRTIHAVFPNCRIYREDAPESPNDPYHKEGSDFTNLVYFCRAPPHPTPLSPHSHSTNTNTPQTHPISFRNPVEADFLGSGARRHYMMPEHEVDPRMKFEVDGEVLDEGNRKMMSEVKRWQEKSAAGHWRLMRTVLPKEVWENW